MRSRYVEYWPYDAHSSEERVAVSLLQLVMKLNIIRHYELIDYHGRDMIEVVLDI